MKNQRERAEDLEAQVKERDVLVEELVLSNQAQLERNETLTVQNEDLRGEFNEAVREALLCWRSNGGNALGASYTIGFRHMIDAECFAAFFTHKPKHRGFSVPQCIQLLRALRI